MLKYFIIESDYMLLQEKQLTHNFDFCATKNQRNNKLKYALINSIIGFIALQTLFLGYHVLYQADHYLEEFRAKSDNTFTYSDNLNKAIDTGDQEKIVLYFNKIKNSKSTLGDEMIGSKILLIHQYESSFTTEQKGIIEITPETIKTLDNIYQQSWNSGHLYVKQQTNNTQCFWADVTCYLGRGFVKNVLQKDIDKSNKRIMANHYNIEHIEQYKDWNKNYRFSEDKKIDDPGTLYVDNFINNLNIKTTP